LDLPEPLGPETTVKPGSTGIAVVPPKDLKLVSSIRLM
jgi:hypothetical protein